VNSVILVPERTQRHHQHHYGYGSLAPRLGFAASLGIRLVVRGGFGLSFFPGDYTSSVALRIRRSPAALTCGSSTTGSMSNTGCPAGIGTCPQGAPVPLAPGDFPTTFRWLCWIWLGIPFQHINAVDLISRPATTINSI